MYLAVLVFFAGTKNRWRAVSLQATEVA